MDAVGSNAMLTSTSTAFCRVNRRRPCLICGKPDWCSFTRENERISICMRVRDGARKINAQGGAIFIHDDRPLPFRVGTKPIQSPLAPIEIRNFVYTRLIEASPASRYRNLLITGEKGLLSRGLKESHFGNYGGLPAEWGERDHLARMFLQEANDQL